MLEYNSKKKMEMMTCLCAPDRLSLWYREVYQE